MSSTLDSPSAYPSYCSSLRLSHVALLLRLKSDCVQTHKDSWLLNYCHPSPCSVCPFPPRKCIVSYRTRPHSPPWILTIIICAVNSWHAGHFLCKLLLYSIDSFPDRTGERFFHLMGGIWLAMIGCIISLSTRSVAARYVALFLMSLGYVGALILR